MANFTCCDAYVWSQDQASMDLITNCYLQKFSLQNVLKFEDGKKFFEELEDKYKIDLPLKSFALIEESVPTKDLIEFLENTHKTIKYRGMVFLYLSEMNTYNKLPPTTKKLLKHLDRNENINFQINKFVNVVPIEDDINYEKSPTLTVSQKQARILIAEDQVNILKIIANVYLPQLGFANIQTAVDGAEALIKIRHCKEINQPIDVVIADWEMPKVNGIQLFQAIQKNGYLDPKRFILLTAHNHLEDVKKAIAAGITSFVTKPFEPEVILNKLAKVL